MLGHLTETAGGLMRPSLRRAAAVVDQAAVYWGGEDVEELGTISGFVLAVFAIDDELDAGTPPESVHAAHQRYLPWRDEGAGKAGHGDVQRMLRRVEGDFAVGEGRAELAARWRLEGEKLITAMWREAAWRTSGRMPPEGEYLANGDASVAIPWMAATMAGLLGDLAATGAGPAREAIDQAARACRLLNDAASWKRERGTGTPNLVRVLMASRAGEKALSESEAMRATRERLEEALNRFRQTADSRESAVGARMRRLVEVLVDHYETGDFPEVIPATTEAR